MDTITIRKPQDTDLDELNRLLKVQWDFHHEIDSTYYVPRLKAGEADIKRDFLDKKDHYCLVALDGDRSIGFIIFVTAKAEHGDTNIQEYVEVYELILDENYRGRGIGKLLLNAVEEQAREMGFEWVSLYCSSYNENALGFYEKSGYADRQRLLFKKLED